MGQLKVTLKRGLSGSTDRQRQTVKGLGLRKRHHTVVVEDTPSVRGMIQKVIHMIDFEEVKE